MLKETQSIWRKAQQLAPSKPAAITPIEYNQLQDAFDYFNTELFDGRLPDVFITYQRRAGSKGYFSANRFTGRTGQSVVVNNLGTTSWRSILMHLSIVRTNRSLRHLCMSKRMFGSDTSVSRGRAAITTRNGRQK